MTKIRPTTISLTDAAEMMLLAVDYLEGNTSKEVFEAVGKAIMTYAVLFPSNAPVVPADLSLIDALRANGLDDYADRIEEATQRLEARKQKSSKRKVKPRRGSK